MFRRQLHVPVCGSVLQVPASSMSVPGYEREGLPVARARSTFRTGDSEARCPIHPDRFRQIPRYTAVTPPYPSNQLETWAHCRRAVNRWWTDPGIDSRSWSFIDFDYGLSRFGISHTSVASSYAGESEDSGDIGGSDWLHRGPAHKGSGSATNLVINVCAGDLRLAGGQLRPVAQNRRPHSRYRDIFDSPLRRTPED